VHGANIALLAILASTLLAVIRILSSVRGEIGALRTEMLGSRIDALSARFEEHLRRHGLV
jgi:hypothetical protein